MSLKERVENHIIVVICVVGVGVAATVFAVSQYFHGQDITRLKHTHVQELLQITYQLASIQRDMPEQRFHDIRTLMHSRSGETRIPEGSTYFDEDRFYAPEDIAYWTYSKTTESELNKRITGEDLPEPFRLAGSAFPIHVWESSGKFNLTTDGDDFVWFPHILLQRVPLAKLPELLQIGVAFGEWLDEDDDFEFDAEDLDPEVDVTEFVQRASAVAHDDVTLFLFHSLVTLQLQTAFLSPNQRYRQVKLQKIGNVLYSQYVQEMRDVTVNEEKGTTFFIRTELILVSTKENLYLLSLVVPSGEPAARGEVYAHVNRWLSGFRVVLD